LKPGRACRREMKLHIGGDVEQCSFLLWVLLEDDMKLAVGKAAVMAVQKSKKLDAATRFE